jgi:hypothetical protein
MKQVPLENIDYIGGDIVVDLVARNQDRYGSESRRFIRLDLLGDPLPTVDLILCRDCLVHLSYADILRALRNICASGSTMILTTTFPARFENTDIVTGQWRALNLQLEPFNFPEPQFVLMEDSTEGRGAYADKSLGLWRISDISAHLPDPTLSHTGL